MGHVDIEKRRAYARMHYNKNKKLYKARSIKHNKNMRLRVKSFILSYLLSHPCVDCGEKDPIVLDFDHRPGSGKIFSIGASCCKNYSVTTVAKEIEKCDVRCANCHRKITYKRAGWSHRDIPVSPSDKAVLS